MATQESLEALLKVVQADDAPLAAGVTMNGQHGSPVVEQSADEGRQVPSMTDPASAGSDTDAAPLPHGDGVPSTPRRLLLSQLTAPHEFSSPAFSTPSTLTPPRHFRTAARAEVLEPPMFPIDAATEAHKGVHGKCVEDVASTVEEPSVSMQTSNGSSQHSYDPDAVKQVVAFSEATAGEMDGTPVASAPAKTVQRGYLWMRGLPFTAGESDIAAFFDGFGVRADDVTLMRRQDGRSSGLAKVKFVREELAHKALSSRNMQRMDGGKGQRKRYIELFLTPPNSYSPPGSSAATYHGTAIGANGATNADECNRGAAHQRVSARHNQSSAPTNVCPTTTPFPMVPPISSWGNAFYAASCAAAVYGSYAATLSEGATHQPGAASLGNDIQQVQAQRAAQALGYAQYCRQMQESFHQAALKEQQHHQQQFASADAAQLFQWRKDVNAYSDPHQAAAGNAERPPYPGPVAAYGAPAPHPTLLTPPKCEADSTPIACNHHSNVRAGEVKFEQI